jgi:hypothetical protein
MTTTSIAHTPGHARGDDSSLLRYNKLATVPAEYNRAGGAKPQVSENGPRLKKLTKKATTPNSPSTAMQIEVRGR